MVGMLYSVMDPSKFEGLLLLSINGILYSSICLRIYVELALAECSNAYIRRLFRCPLMRLLSYIKIQHIPLASRGYILRIYIK
jgi:hypothetical protein